MKVTIPAAPDLPRTRRLLRALRRPVFWLLIVGTLGGGVYYAWQQVRDRVTVAPENLIDASQITLTPPPTWIHSDIKAQVLRDAGFGSQLSLLDERLTINVAQAFALHPWIAKVTRVSKSKETGVTVEVLYRQPVAMVEVAGGLLAVDAEGIVLPSDDFTADDAKNYPRISGILTGPRGPVGTRWGDAGVVTAAQLAIYLRDHWQPLKLKKIIPQTGDGSDRLSFALVTAGERTLPWGRLPGQEFAGELPATEKIAKLRRHVAENGSLDTGDPFPAENPRTATRPFAPSVQP